VASRRSSIGEEPFTFFPHPHFSNFSVAHQLVSDSSKETLFPTPLTPLRAYVARGKRAESRVFLPLFNGGSRERFFRCVCNVFYPLLWTRNPTEDSSRFAPQGEHLVLCGAMFLCMLRVERAPSTQPGSSPLPHTGTTATCPSFASPFDLRIFL